MDRQLKTGKFDVTKYEQMARKLRRRNMIRWRRRRKILIIYILFVDENVEILFCCKRELVLYRIILITRIDLYISENNERETCSRTVYSFTEASLRKSSDFPAH
jgi:hypothetical protein